MGCYNTRVVAAPVDRVWSALRNFHDMGWAAPVIEKLDVVGDAAGDQIGAQRVLNGVFRETLRALDDTRRLLRYSIDDGPEAVAKESVSGYVGTLRVWPVTNTGQTFVEWSSRWESSGGGVKAFCDPIYRALLDALERHFA